MKNNITFLEIENFKSIKKLKIDCKRVNVFIGAPNTGKSNILEALGLFSYPYYHSDSKIYDFVRAENMTHLFYELETDKKIFIKCNLKGISIDYKPDNDQYNFELTEYQSFLENGKPIGAETHSLWFKNDFSSSIPGTLGNTSFRFYKFKEFVVFSQSNENYLLPPYGKNLENVLLTHKKISEYIGRIIKENGKRFAIRHHENRIEEQKDKDDLVVAPLPYLLFSDGIKRLMFNLAAIETNVNSTIMFEEPESHYFPFYSKYFAERIALNNSNQFFLTTHNPTFLLTLLDKVKKEEIMINYTTFQNFKTNVKQLSELEKQKLIDYDLDPFFNFKDIFNG